MSSEHHPQPLRADAYGPRSDSRQTAYEAAPASHGGGRASPGFKQLQHGVQRGVAKTLRASLSVGEAFAAFVNRGNVVDLAVGIVVGAAFTAIVNSFVNDLITPVIGLATQRNLANLFLVIHCAANATLACKRGTNHPYGTVLQAATDGAATWNYGNFIQTVINFLLVAMAMFLVVQIYTNTFLKITKKQEEETTKICEACQEHCHIKAWKCKWCLTLFPPAQPPMMLAEPSYPPQAQQQQQSRGFHKMFHKT